jgi:hypothetical protein
MLVASCVEDEFYDFIDKDNDVVVDDILHKSV